MLALCLGIFLKHHSAWAYCCEKEMKPIFKSRWAVSPAIQVRLSLMINRCQKLHVQLCSSSRDFATTFFCCSLSSALGAHSVEVRGAVGSSRLSSHCGCSCLLSIPSPFGDIMCKCWALWMLPQLMSFEGQS